MSIPAAVPLHQGSDYLNRSAALSPALILCAVGLFTLSWDRIGNITIGTYNVKLSAIAFLLAFVAASVGGQVRHRQRVTSSVIWITTAITLSLLVSSLLANEVQIALQQVAVTAIGAFLPFGALIKAARSRQNLVFCLNWFVRGVLIAVFFGFYQLTASYLRLPQFVDYTGLSGGVGRIAAFSYEPATFGQIVLTGFAAVLARSILVRGSLPRTILFLFALAAVLANTRALLLTFPAFLLLARPWKLSPRSRTFILLAAVGVSYASLIVILIAPGVLDFVVSQFASIFNPHEQSSNARRLDQYAIVSGLLQGAWLFGIGPGNLFFKVSLLNQSVFDGKASNQVVANNIWLQAMADGGVILALIELTLILLVISKLFFRAPVATRTLASAWLSLILISGMVGSDFFTPARWVLLALACVALSFETDPVPKLMR